MEGTTLHAILAPGKKVEAAKAKLAAAKPPAGAAQTTSAPAGATSVPSQSAPQQPVAAQSPAPSR